MARICLMNILLGLTLADMQVQVGQTECPVYMLRSEVLILHGRESEKNHSSRSRGIAPCGGETVTCTVDSR